jgi:serine/threonine protein kinase
VAGTSGKFGERYEVVELLGKGGMGEVYFARDKRLRRDVAIKVLPDIVARDPDRVALFQREAQIIAGLNHPNIAAIHELEESNGVCWLVLEMVRGETLEEQLKRGPLPLRDALAIAKQICNALEAAHETGIIHRDLKPANIKISPNGTVKLLDFGLASAFDVNPKTTDLGRSPTLPATSIAAHAGTAAYMSPEQFQWKTINKQVDVWGLGCVLFEMLTGKCAFQAATLQETATLVLETQPDWTLLNHVPPELLNLIQRCLQKDRKIRLHDIADARIEIDQVLGERSTRRRSDAAAATRSMPSRWRIPATLLVVASFIGWIWAVRQPSPAPASFPAVRFTIPVTQTNSITQISVSPNGRKIAYVAGSGQGTRIIWVRDIGSATPWPMPAAEDPGGLFWGWDNAHIAFFDHEELKSLDIRDATVTTIAHTPGATSGSWNKSNDILVDGPKGDGLFLVSAQNGKRTRITSPNRATGERHYQPQFLPDGRHFLFLVRTNEPGTTGTYIGSLDSNERRFLTTASSKAMFSSPSQIFFVRDGTLFRQAFDIDPPRLSGEAVRIADHVSSSAISGSAAFSVSPTGVLAYRSGSSFQNATLQWFDRRGKQLEVTAEPAVYTQVALSPDEKYIAVERRDPDSGLYDIWLADPIKHTNTRLTSGDSSQRNPFWLRDSRHLIYSSDKSGFELLKMNVGSIANPELILKRNEVYRPVDVTPNNTLLLRDDGRSFFTLAPGSQEPEVLFTTGFLKSGGRLSPDGRWLAFSSAESSRLEVYVISFPKPDYRQQVSTNGGIQPLWNDSGTELFYLDPAGHMMSVSVDQNQGFVAGIPKLLFDTGVAPTAGLSQYAVNGKGTKFLTIPPVPQEQPTPIDVIVSWSEGLQP